MESKNLTRLQQENFEAAQAESKEIKEEIKKRLARILARMQASGEIKQNITIEDILKEDN